MKERSARRTTKAVRETAEQELAELLPAIEAVTADSENKESTMKRSVDRARAEKMQAYSVERVTREIGDLQLSVSRMLTDLSQQLREESGKLAEIRLAIEAENARLKELHDIDAAVVSLKAILEVAADRRALLDAELREREENIRKAMEAAKAEWDREQIEHEQRIKKAREREEDEYTYKLSLKRRKDTDDHAAQQISAQRTLQEQRLKAEQEIEERTRVIASREGEMSDLRTRVDRFPQELAAAAKQAEQAARSEAQKQAALDAKLLKMETEAERNITALKITGLEDLVKRQTSQIEAMTKQLAAAQGQVQAMAVKAIEGAAGMKVTPGQ